jgi:hypothetical protein
MIATEAASAAPMIPLQRRAMRALPRVQQGAEQKPDETAWKCGRKERCTQPRRLGHAIARVSVHEARLRADVD